MDFTKFAVTLFVILSQVKFQVKQSIHKSGVSRDMPWVQEKKFQRLFWRSLGMGLPLLEQDRKVLLLKRLFHVSLTIFTGTARKDAGTGVIGTICQKWHQQKQERLNLISSLNLQATWSPVCPLITNGWIYIRQTDLDTSHSPTCQEIQTMEAKTSAFIGKHQLVKLFRTQWITPGQQPIFARKLAPDARV